MVYFFKQAVHLGGKDYSKGVNHVTEKAENDPTFLKYVGLGLIEDVEAAKVISTETREERSKKLLDRLMQKHAPKAEPEALSDEKMPEAPVGAPKPIESESLKGKKKR